MNLKRRDFFGFALTCLFILFLACFAFRLTSLLRKTISPVSDLSHNVNGEDFDPSYIRLNNIDKMIAFCDSLYAANTEKRLYPDIVSQVLRKKFYHGYSYYDKWTNPLIVAMDPLILNGISAIVVPDDIVKFPSAACSQQSLVGMEIFQRKGYDVRKIAMFDTVTHTGHFAYEVYYDKSWHYFDTNQEPDTEVLNKYNRPSTAFLTNHPEIVAAAYHKQKHPDMFQRLILSHTVGRINVFSAPNAYVVQKATQFLCNYGWIIFGICLYAWKRRRKKIAKMQTLAKVENATVQATEITRKLDAAKAV